MRVTRALGQAPRLIDAEGFDVPLTAFFLRAVLTRGSPNTAAAYAYDLKHFFAFLAAKSLALGDMRPRHAIELLIYLREEAHVARGRRPLAPMSINRIMAAISNFFDHLILSDAVAITTNPLGTLHTGRDTGPRNALAGDTHAFAELNGYPGRCPKLR